MTSKLLPKAIGAVAILGVAGGVSAQTSFNVTTTVQNALTVTKVQDLNLGTLFAVNSNSSAYKYITLTPAGTYPANAAGHSSITLLSLGGQQAARGSVAVGSQQPLRITLPASSYGASLAADGTDGLTDIRAAQSAAGAVAVRLADPAAARFYLGDFRVGAVSGGTIDTAACATANTCQITPSFGSTSVSFGIGATLVTDVIAETTSEAYQQATYTGTFDVQATY